MILEKIPSFLSKIFVYVPYRFRLGQSYTDFKNEINIYTKMDNKKNIFLKK